MLFRNELSDCVLQLSVMWYGIDIPKKEVRSMLKDKELRKIIGSRAKSRR